MVEANSERSYSVSDEVEEIEVEEVNDNEQKKNVYFNEEEEILEEEASDDNNSDEEEGEKSKGGKKSSKSSDNGSDSVDEAEDQDIEIEVEEGMQFTFDKINELLYYCQSIGKPKESDSKVYVKNKYCELSLRDIHRFLRKDDPENPICKLNVLRWHICDRDVIPLILSYENNEKLQQLGLVVMVDLTEALPDLCEKRDQIEKSLSELQIFIANSSLVEHLGNILATSTAKIRDTEIMRNSLADITKNKDESTERFKIHEYTKLIAENENKYQQLIEIIFVLLKQILNVYHNDDIQQNTDSYLLLLKKIAVNKIYDAIIYHSHNLENEFNKRLAPPCWN